MTKKKFLQLNSANAWAHITYIPIKDQYRVSKPDRRTTYHGTLAAAVAVRDLKHGGA